MPRNRVRRATRMVTGALALVLGSGLSAAGCTASDPARSSAVIPVAWARVQLPTGVVPSSLTAGDRLLIGGHTGSGDAVQPVLLAVDADGAASPIPLRPHSPYAKVADLVSIAANGKDLVALGAAHGGAHGNFRWTVWRGNPAGLDDQPQTFETFGGQNAGSLLGVVGSSEGPLIAGTWSGRYGLDAAVWRPAGSRWLRTESAGTALANQSNLQVAPRAAAAADRQVLLAGSVITFAGGVSQHAAVWSSPGSGQPWQLIRLPESGSSSEARSVRCTESTCWISGVVDGHAALWSVADEQPARHPELPNLVVDPDGHGPQTVLNAGRPAVLASHAGSTALLATDGQRWRRFCAPAGQVGAAAEWGERLYAVFTDGGTTTLWSTDLAATRTG